MLLYLILLYLTRHATHAAPLSLRSRESFDVIPPSDTLTCSCPNQRSVLHILWSCLATIFTCSWVSVHPNIPGPDDSWIKTALRRMALMFWAFIAPEMIIFWAIRQWWGARRLAQKWKGECQGWTKTHGYFIQMGGFMLYKRGKPTGVLSPEQLERLCKERRIRFPTITEEEIQDRSKANALSKTIVIGQTTWFILQCIARALQVLDITQLELLTLALALLNGFMCFFWWHKPLDVQTPVPVYLLDRPLKDPLSVQSLGVSPCTPVRMLVAQTTYLARLPLTLSTSEEGPSPFLPILITTHRPSRLQALGAFFQDARKYVINSVPSATRRAQGIVKANGYGRGFLVIVIEKPVDILSSAVSPLGDMCRSETIDEGKVRVPTFYALRLTSEDDANNVMLSVSAIAMAFGAIHCAGWALAFPSRTEAWIWRTSSVAISVTPLLLILAPSFSVWSTRVERGSLTEKFAKGLMLLFGFPAVVMLPVYVFARVLLLVEAFISLRALTPGALAVVKWTSFLPHI